MKRRRPPKIPDIEVPEATSDAEYWWAKALRAAALARSAESEGNIRVMNAYDDEYMTCLFNHYIGADRSGNVGV